jgi:monovalent cation:H+ antiporter-2, CPA2 family
LEGQQALPFLKDTLLFLSLAGILIPLLQRLRINQILGFLAAGALVGPFGLGLLVAQMPTLDYFTFSKASDIKPFGQLGILFLMFMIGLDLPTERLWALRRWVFGAGSAQILLSTVAIGALAWFFDNGLEAAIVLGLVLSLSSTAVAMQLMNDQRALGTSLGQASFSILMLQDLAVVPIFILLGVLAHGGGDVLPLAAGALVKSVAVIALIYVVGRRVIRPVFRSLAGKHQPDVFMALILLSSLGIAAATAAAGLSMALGAFLAGLLLAETEFRHEVEVTIEPFKGLLMGLFFMSVGMQIDVREIIHSPTLLLLSVLGLFVIKSAAVSLVLRAGGLKWSRAIEGGCLLWQGGEFAFIVVGYAISSKLLTPDVGQFMMLVVGISLFLTPMTAKAGRLFAQRRERHDDERWAQSGAQSSAQSIDAAPVPMDRHVIIAGFGRVGQLIAQVLSAQGIPYLALESDARLVAEQRMKGCSVFFGNAARAELLKKVHADRAAAIILTMDHPASALYAVKGIRRRYPEVPLFARSRDEKHAIALKEAGASVVVPETLETGLQLAAFGFQTLGMTENTAAQLVQLERERQLSALQLPKDV